MICNYAKPLAAYGASSHAQRLQRRAEGGKSFQANIVELHARAHTYTRIHPYTRMCTRATRTHNQSIFR